MKANTEILKAQSSERKAAIDEQSELAAVEQKENQMLLNADLDDREQEHHEAIDEAKLTLAAMQEDHKQEMDKLNLLLDAQKLEIEQVKVMLAGMPAPDIDVEIEVEKLGKKEDKKDEE